MFLCFFDAQLLISSWLINHQLIANEKQSIWFFVTFDMIKINVKKVSRGQMEYYMQKKRITRKVIVDLQRFFC